MRVEALVPDVATPALGPVPAPPSAAANTFGALVDAAAGALDRAGDAEAAFAAHRGGLQEMVVERARADIALQIAAAAAQRVTQGVQTLLGMQV
jgi:flagellar hook-basal body complex protein FliE